LLSKRIRLLIVLLCLPVVALLVWWGAVQLDLQRTPAPRWDLPALGMICWGDYDLAGARPGDPPPERVSETPPGTLPAGRAALIARHTFDKYVGGLDLNSFLLYGEGPTLVHATFPDGKTRLAWRCISLISEDDMGMSGVAAAVYLDATSGEPLALVRDIVVCEPSWSPLFLSQGEYRFRVELQTSGQFVLLALYVAVVLLTAGVVSGIRWLRARHRRPVRPDDRAR
jgi:hypothetical protein